MGTRGTKLHYFRRMRSLSRLATPSKAKNGRKPLNSSENVGFRGLMLNVDKGKNGPI